jgi:hypothetical protein
MTPNPATSSVSIEYAVPRSMPVTLKIYDVLGRLVQSVDGASYSGMNQLKLDVRNLTSGNYFVKLIGGNIVRTDKLLIIK